MAIQKDANSAISTVSIHSLENKLFLSFLLKYLLNYNEIYYTVAYRNMSVDSNDTTVTGTIS